MNVMNIARVSSKFCGLDLREGRWDWSGRDVLAGNMGFTPLQALAEQKRVRELLAQSRELLKQMQAD